MISNATGLKAIQVRYIVHYTVRVSLAFSTKQSESDYTWYGTITARNQIRNTEKANFLVDFQGSRGCTMCWYLLIAMATKLTDTTEIQV